MRIQGNLVNISGGDFYIHMKVTDELNQLLIIRYKAQLDNILQAHYLTFKYEGDTLFLENLNDDYIFVRPEIIKITDYVKRDYIDVTGRKSDKGIYTGIADENGTCYVIIDDYLRNFIGMNVMIELTDSRLVIKNTN